MTRSVCEVTVARDAAQNVTIQQASTILAVPTSIHHSCRTAGNAAPPRAMSAGLPIRQASTILAGPQATPPRRAR
jgi:hypothetical protein